MKYTAPAALAGRPASTSSRASGIARHDNIALISSEIPRGCHVLAAKTVPRVRKHRGRFLEDALAVNLCSLLAKQARHNKQHPAAYTHTCVSSQHDPVVSFQVRGSSKSFPWSCFVLPGMRRGGGWVRQSIDCALQRSGKSISHQFRVRFQSMVCAACYHVTHPAADLACRCTHKKSDLESRGIPGPDWSDVANLPAK